MDLQFSMAIINLPKFTSSKLLTVLCTLFIFTSPRNIMALSTTSTSLHQLPPEITQEFTAMMLYHRRNQCRGYDEQMVKRLRAVTATQHQNERSAAR